MCLETGCEQGKLSEGADAKEQRHEAAENRGRRADDAVWSRDWRLQVWAVNEAASCGWSCRQGPGGPLVSCYKVRFLVLKVW